MRKAVVRAAALGVFMAALLQPGLAAAQSGAWALRQNAESCYLSRSFATPAGQVDLTIQSFGPETAYHFILSGAGLPLKDQRAVATMIGFGGEQAATKSLTLFGKAGSAGMLVFAASLPRPVSYLGWYYQGAGMVPFLARIDPDATVLFYQAPDVGPLTLPLGPMQAEYSRLDACGRALDQKWAAASGNSSPATAPTLLQGKETNWHIKYPENLLLARVSGLVELRMTVDAQGRAHDCVVQRATWASRFGEDACSQLEKIAHFEPAHDAAGKPTPALFRTSMSFIIYDW